MWPNGKSTIFELLIHYFHSGYWLLWMQSITNKEKITHQILMKTFEDRTKKLESVMNSAVYKCDNSAAFCNEPTYLHRHFCVVRHFCPAFINTCALYGTIRNSIDWWTWNVCSIHSIRISFWWKVSHLSE